MDYVFAYLDAGTGTLLLQLLAGGIAGVVALVKFRWKSVRGWVRREEKTGE